MDYRVSAQERATFKRCRRQWDFGSIHRQRQQPIQPAPVDLNQAIRDALAVYYYPGMWDWHSAIVLPLVRKAFMRSIAAAPPSKRRMADLDIGTQLLEQYFAWAPSIDDFGPLKIETDVEVLIPDIREPGRGLLTATGQAVNYTERVAMVAADGADEYWVVVHRVVPDWQNDESLLLDEAAIAACWAWEQTYLGMEVAGTIHNEMLICAPEALDPAPEETRTGRSGRGGFSQNEPSGGGRSLPRTQRPERPEGQPVRSVRMEQEVSGPVRRTRIRRGRAEIQAAVTQIAAEALEMVTSQLPIYPTPSPRHCPGCAFLAPCLALSQGNDPALELAAHFQQGPEIADYEPRLGAGGGGGRNISLPGKPPSPPT